MRTFEPFFGGETTYLSPSGSRYVWSNHLLRIDNAIELSFCDKTYLEGSSLERQVVIIRVVGDLRRLVVADHRRKRRNQHERLLNVLIDLFRVGLRAFDEEYPEIRARIGQQGDRMCVVVNDQGLV